MLPQSKQEFAGWVDSSQQGDKQIKGKREKSLPWKQGEGSLLPLFGVGLPSI